MFSTRSRFWVMVLSSCALLVCGGGGRAIAGVMATSTISAWVEGANFPSGIGYNLVDPAIETFGGAYGSGNHTESWFAANPVNPLPGNAVTGFAGAQGNAQTMDPMGESHANSFANSKGLKFVNANAAPVAIDLVVEWIYYVQVTVGDAAVDTGDAGFYFRVRNLTNSTTLQEHSVNIALGEESAHYGAMLQLTLPAQSSTIIRVEGQCWADAYTVPAPSAAMAMMLGAMSTGARRRRPQAPHP